MDWLLWRWRFHACTNGSCLDGDSPYPPTDIVPSSTTSSRRTCAASTPASSHAFGYDWTAIPWAFRVFL